MSSNVDSRKLAITEENRNTCFRSTGNKELDDSLTLLHGLQKAQDQPLIVLLRFVYAVNKNDHFLQCIAQLKNQSLQLFNLGFSATAWPNKDRFEASL